MSKFLAAGRSLYECHKSIRFIFSTTALIIFLAAFAPGLAAQQSQLQNLNAGCGADYLGQTWNCTAGEISISQVTGLQIQGNPTYCVIGEPLVILTANVEYSINTQARNDLTMYLGDQEGTDPRLFAGPGQSCSAFSVPGPFNPTPDQNNPWGNNDGDACGDLAFSVTAASRPFANVPISCQDNDQDGFAHLQVLLTWDQNDKAICGQGPGQGKGEGKPDEEHDPPVVRGNSTLNEIVLKTGISKGEILQAAGLPEDVPAREPLRDWMRDYDSSPRELRDVVEKLREEKR